MTAGRIQKARVVLAKWRSKVTSPLPWALDGESGVVDTNGHSIVSTHSREAGAWSEIWTGDDALIVGIAGNADLLDAIDGLLVRAEWADQGLGSGVPNPSVDRVIDAIIAANERMSA